MSLGHIQMWVIGLMKSLYGLTVGSVSFGGAVTTGGALTTPGPFIITRGRATAQVAAVTTVATVTVGAADGTFEVSSNISVTTATLHSISVTCTYTDEGNVSRTLTLGFAQLAGATLITLITNVTSTGPYESMVYHIRAKAGTAITIATTGTFTTIAYNVEGVIKQTG